MFLCCSDVCTVWSVSVSICTISVILTHVGSSGLRLHWLAPPCTPLMWLAAFTQGNWCTAMTTAAPRPSLESLWWCWELGFLDLILPWSCPVWAHRSSSCCTWNSGSYLTALSMRRLTGAPLPRALGNPQPRQASPVEPHAPGGAAGPTCDTCPRGWGTGVRGWPGVPARSLSALHWLQFHLPIPAQAAGLACPRPFCFTPLQVPDSPCLPLTLHHGHLQSYLPISPLSLPGEWFCKVWDHLNEVLLGFCLTGLKLISVIAHVGVLVWSCSACSVWLSGSERCACDWKIAG